MTSHLDQSEDPIVVAAITLIVREADEMFERVGGSSRHWVRDCFLPVLNRRGWFVETTKDEGLVTLETRQEVASGERVDAKRKPNA